MIQLYIIRHGETEENAQGILQGHLQGHLTEKGKQQARELRARIVNEIHPDHIESSDLQRTVDTSNIINEGFHVNIETTPLLRERDWGILTGKLISALPHDFPPSVESVAQMMERARQYLLTIWKKYEKNNLSILIVSHGVFSRCLQAVAQGKQIYEIPRMNNGELRHITLSEDTYQYLTGDLTCDESKDNTDYLKQGSES